MSRIIVQAIQFSAVLKKIWWNQQTLGNLVM